MTRPVKILAWILAVVVVLLAVLAIVIATFDWNRLKPTINERVSSALGRPFAINGDLSVEWRRATRSDGGRSLLPWPHISAEDLTLGNPEWAKTDHFVAARRVEFTLSPLGLLSKRITIPRIDFTAPSANIERLEDGRNNWTFGNDEPQDEKSAESGWRFQLGEIGFDEGRIGVEDEKLQASLEIGLDPLGQPIPFKDLAGAASSGEPDSGKAPDGTTGKGDRDDEAAQPQADKAKNGERGRDEKAGREQDRGGAVTPQPYAFAWDAKGRYRGQALKGEGRIGGLLALQDEDKPFPLQADLTIGKTMLALAGTMTDLRNLGAMDFDLKLSGQSMSELFPIIGVTLPDTPRYSTNGHLVVRLHEPDGSLYRYEDFTGKVGESDLSGTFSYTATEPRAKLEGDLTSRQLRFADLGPLIGVGSEAAEDKQPPDKALPVQEFRTERWRAMDANVKFAGKRIERGGDALTINDLDTHLVLEDGVLRLEPLKFGMAGGRVEISTQLDGRKKPMPGRMAMSARGFKLKELFPEFDPMQTSLGELNASAELAGQGNSVAELLGSSNGELSAVIDQGVVSRKLMELVGLNVARYVVTELFQDDLVRINCAVANLTVKDGLMSTRLFLFDTENATIYVDGNVDLDEERLDLNVHPRSKGVRLISFRTPLYVRGSFKDPDPGVHPGPLAARGAGMAVLGAAIAPIAGLLALIGGSTEEKNQCASIVGGGGGEPPPAPKKR